MRERMKFGISVQCAAQHAFQSEWLTGCHLGCAIEPLYGELGGIKDMTNGDAAAGQDGLKLFAYPAVIVSNYGYPEAQGLDCRAPEGLGFT